MNMSMQASGLRQYQEVRAAGGTADASPHRLIQLLFEGLLECLAAAHGHIERGEPAARGEAIGKAIAILGGLREALDFERGGELAANLEELYAYCERRLVEASRDNDRARLDEVAGLMRQIKEGWDAIAPGHDAR